MQQNTRLFNDGNENYLAMQISQIQSKQQNIPQTRQSYQMPQNIFYAQNQQQNVKYQNYKENTVKTEANLQQQHRMSLNQESSFDYQSLEQRKSLLNPLKSVDNIVKKPQLQTNNALKMQEMIDQCLEKVQNSIINNQSLNSSNLTDACSDYLKRRDKSFSKVQGKLQNVCHDLSLTETKKAKVIKQDIPSQTKQNQIHRINTVKDLIQQNQNNIQKSQVKTKNKQNEQLIENNMKVQEPVLQTVKRSQTPNLTAKKGQKDIHQKHGQSVGQNSQIKKSKQGRQQLSSDISSAITSKYSSTHKQTEVKCLQKSKSQGKYIVQIPKKKEKTAQEKKLYVHHRLTVLFQGFKVRRILKQCKIVKQLRKEYRDLIKFANSLKEELNEQVRSQSTSIGPIKALLIQSVRDLNKKKEQFYHQFFDIYHSKQWLQLSKFQQQTSIDTPQSQRSTRSSNQQFFSKTQQYNKDSQLVSIQEENQQQNKQVAAVQLKQTQKESNKSQVRESRERQVSNMKVDNPKIEDAKLRMSFVSRKDEQNDQLKAIKKQEEVKNYLTQTQDYQAQQSIKEDKKKQFLKKGIQSRKYDPLQAIEQERERKKQKTEKEKVILAKIQREEEEKKQKELDFQKKFSIGTPFLLSTRSQQQKQQLHHEEYTPQPIKLFQEPQTTKQFQKTIFSSQVEDLSASGQFLSKIPRLIRNQNPLNQSVQHCQSTKNINCISSFMSNEHNEQILNVSKGKMAASRDLNNPEQKNSYYCLNQKSFELPGNSLINSYDHSKIKLKTPSANIDINNNKSARVSQDMRQPISFGRESERRVNKRILNQSCQIESSGNHVTQLIQELQSSQLSQEAKVKTIETLSAITGMLQSLRDKKILTNENSQDKIKKNHYKEQQDNNIQLKQKFDSLIRSLQKEFDQLTK